jgi:hypothetical protein
MRLALRRVSEKRRGLLGVMILFRRSWPFLGVLGLVGLGAAGFILWRYVRSGAGPAEVSSWFAVGGVTLLALLLLSTLLTATTRLRTHSLRRFGEVHSLATTDSLAAWVRARAVSGEIGTMPKVVSLTTDNRGMRFWEGGLDPLAAIEWAEVADLALEPRSDAWIYRTPALSIAFRERNGEPLRLPLLAPSLVGFGPMSISRAGKVLASVSASRRASGINS